MKCGVCKSHMPIRSNAAVVEELQRLSAPVYGTAVPSCQNEDCDNFCSPVTEVGLYARFGRTPAGTPRWRCNACRKTFSQAGAPLLRQRMAHKNRDVFALLVNKSPLRRIAEVADIDVKTVYAKISFVHRQCRAFAGERERRLFEGMTLPKVYLAVDRQTHNVNWSNRKDRRNVVLNAIASADLVSGYVFGFNLNFDPALDPEEVEREALAIGDASKLEPFRHFARIWLSHDYGAAVATSAISRKKRLAKGSKPTQADRLAMEIVATYEKAQKGPDVEASNPEVDVQTLPARGMQVREQYTMHGHFQLVAAMLQGAEKVRVYMDQDSGIRAAFLAAFADRIKDRTADGWYVSVLKETTIYEKERAVQGAKARLDEAAALHPGLTRDELLVEMMKEEMRRTTAVGQYGDQWLEHPMPNMSEPAKKVCWLTDMGDYDEEHAARLYLRASLHAVDRFFMQARRRLSLAERSIVTASKDRRVWHGYSAYRPENLAKVLEIFRVFYNYCKVGEDKKTPAMRFGLAKAPVKLEDVLYFQPATDAGARWAVGARTRTIRLNNEGARWVFSTSW